MWNLLMGGTYSSSEGEEEVEPNMEPKMEQKAEQKLEKQDLELASLHNRDKALEVHRIPSPTRECGDGSENATPRKADNISDSAESVGNSAEITPISPMNDPVKLIRLPKTNILLNKLPPIRDEGLNLPQTEPTSPLVQLSLGHPQRLAKKHSGTKKEKQPKFVPYEPYKAAITQIVSKPKKRLSSSRESDGTKPEEDGTPVKLETELEQGVPPTETELELKSEIDKLKAELEEKDKQLRIQTQVNCEVKRLLVASVGEDIEAKVDFLTQDKARLSADIRQYASKISRDFEEKEHLTVESTLWKSKFLACSVIVDELARCKANLMHKTDEYEHNLRLLFHEHSVLWSTLIESYTVLAKLRSAFDPLAASLAPAEAASFLGLADHTLKVAKELRSRLMGETKLKETMNSTNFRNVIPSAIDSPAEEGLKKTMAKNFSNGSGEYSELASLAVTGAAKPHLRKLGDQLTSPSGFKNCTHCHGTVHNI